MDITYLPMARGFVYLAAVMDWATRRVLAWRLSNSMATGFCLEALAEAIEQSCNPEIFNPDHGSQFTSEAFTGLLKAHAIKLSMDRKGAWRDHVFIQRLWRSVKYEKVYLRAYDSVSHAHRARDTSSSTTRDEPPRALHGAPTMRSTCSPQPMPKAA